MDACILHIVDPACTFNTSTPSKHTPEFPGGTVYNLSDGSFFSIPHILRQRAPPLHKYSIGSGVADTHMWDARMRLHMIR